MRSRQINSGEVAKSSQVKSDYFAKSIAMQRIKRSLGVNYFFEYFEYLTGFRILQIIERYKDTKIQRYKDTKIQRYNIRELEN